MSTGTGNKRAVAVLCACRSSHYFDLASEVFDLRRDALSYLGDLPVVAHPPCRAFGKLRHFAKPDASDFELGAHSIASVRTFGGVVEHPAHSLLFSQHGVPLPGFAADAFGGYTVPLFQSWFGHRAPKMTWLYVVGIQRRDFPAFPLALGVPSGRIENMGKAERERTPVELAKFLVNLAARCEA